MTTWWHHPTIFNLRLNRRLATRVSCIILLCIALITTLFFGVVSRAAPGVNSTIGFQGRLLDSSGNIVADGSYNMQFKIYQGGTGTVAGNPGGTLKWTETYVNNGNATGAVEVKNGFMSVNLGSNNPFGNQVDWNQDTLWLSMNVAGASVGCATFGSAPCNADGEMLPMKRLTATPYSLNSAALNGKTADNFVQLAQGVQNDASLNTSSIYINKTGTGNLVQLQNTANDVFTINNDGDVRFGNNANHSLSVDASGANVNGRDLAMSAGAGGTGTGSNGGTLNLQGGAAGGTNGNGGDIQINAGTKTGTGTDGTISIGTASGSSINIGGTSTALNQNINIGTNNTSGSVSNVTIGSGEAASSGTTIVQAKDEVAIKAGGETQATFSSNGNTLYLGNGSAVSAPNNYTVQGSNSTSAGVDGGSLTVQGGNATSGNANGGNLTLGGGTGSGTGADGLVVINTPTFSTVSDDANCYTNGTSVANSCTVTANSVNNAAAIIVGFTTAGKTATIPDPTITTAGRIIYVTAANGSKDFTLSVNGGGKANETVMRQNTTTSLLWNGSDWTVAGASNYGVNTTDDIQNVQIGSGADDESTTLLTLDKASAAPTITDEALLGSMYYDTTIGKVQCYEADGWGACSSSPDSFVTLSPEYANSVKNGNGIGTMSSDLCSDTLNINDGSSAQPLVCGTNETFNYYNWKSTELTDQTKSIYVTYQLPSNFKQFVSGSTSLMGRTDSINSEVSYQVYRNTATGLVACGATVAASTGSQSTWQKASATGTADPSTCNFAAGESVVFKINLTANTDANAYASNLNFAFSNQ